MRRVESQPPERGRMRYAPWHSELLGPEGRLQSYSHYYTASKHSVVKNLFQLTYSIGQLLTFAEQHLHLLVLRTPWFSWLTWNSQRAPVPCELCNCMARTSVGWNEGEVFLRFCSSERELAVINSVRTTLPRPIWHPFHSILSLLSLLSILASDHTTGSLSVSGYFVNRTYIYICSFILQCHVRAVRFYCSFNFSYYTSFGCFISLGYVLAHYDVLLNFDLWPQTISILCICISCELWV